MHFQTALVLLAAVAALAAQPPHKLPIPTPTPTATVPKAVPADQGPKILVALPNYDEETSTRLQIFLDNSDFGPGKIDGKMGEFFRKALVHYKRAHKMPE